MQVRLEGTSTVYMDGTSVYTLKYVDKPGIITTLVLSIEEYETMQSLLATSR